jgi:acyl carrier protein
MTRDEIRAKLTEILRDIFDEDALVAVDALNSEDVAEWDSTNHVRLMVAIEAEFGIRFETDEITAPENVGEILDMIQAKRIS